VKASGTATEEEKAEADKARYGPDFVYEEFLQTKSKLSAFVMSACLVVAFTLLTFVRPVSVSLSSQSPLVSLAD
jgi:hypothetical protein